MRITLTDVRGDDEKVSFYFYLEYEIDSNNIEVFNANITHNLCKMASEAGIYKALWRPEEIGVVYAKDITDLLMQGLEDLKERPEYFKQFNAENGWGLYKHFIPFVEECLAACIKYPNAMIYTSR